MTIVIIEDEHNAFEILRKRILKILPDAQITAHLKSIIESINWFKKEAEPDLVFLDIELADGQSFEIFNHIQLSCPVIFTTAYDQYAIQAFTLNSVDYLLKPITGETLQKALDKYQRMKSVYGGFDLEPLKQLLQPTAKTKRRKRFLVHSGERYFFIKTQDIAYFYSEDGLTFLKTMTNQRHILNDSLDALQGTIDQEQFFRINRHQIIQLEAIHTIHEYLNHRFKLTLQPHLQPHHEFIVSRLRRSEFKKWLNDA